MKMTPKRYMSLAQVDMATNNVPLKGTNSKVTKATTVIPAVIILSRVSVFTDKHPKGTGLFSCGPFRFVTP